MSIKEVFDNVALEYDRDRKVLIPCFDDFYGMAVRLVQEAATVKPRILDLGIGTGLLSALILEEYPAAEITGIDLSARMLAEAEKRFAGKVRLVESNYLNEDFGAGYDVIVSSLSIHHLSGAEKAVLFKKIYGALKVNGIFINADQVAGQSVRQEKLYREIWYEQMRGLGLSDELLAASEERMREDKMSTLSAQLEWLDLAGFSDVNCWYKSGLFTVYAGFKS